MQAETQSVGFSSLFHRWVKKLRQKRVFKNFMVAFLRIRFNGLKPAELIQREVLLFASKFPVVTLHKKK